MVLIQKEEAVSMPFHLLYLKSPGGLIFLEDEDIRGMYFRPGSDNLLEPLKFHMNIYGMEIALECLKLSDGGGIN